MISTDIEFDSATGIRLRPYQQDAADATEAGWERYRRQLVVHATGTGKGSLAAYWAKQCVERGQRMLFLAHRESLITQTSARIEEQGEVPVEIEMADQSASLSAQVVCASVQTLCSLNRLTGWPDDHFDLIIADESHRSIAVSWQRVLNYFHFGECSLAEGWKLPDGNTPVKTNCRVIGLTATPDLTGDRDLGIFYQHVAHSFNLLQAVQEGWLVRPIAKSVPVQADLRGLKAKRTANGSDLSDSDVAERLSPILEELAKQTKILAGNRKTIVFLPSVKCAIEFAFFANQAGLNASWCSGEFPQALEAFRSAGPGSVIANAQLIVEGVDLPDVDCVGMYRGTKSRTYYCQGSGRASRPLPGILDGCRDVEERLAAIAASKKPNFLILDPLWLSDRLQLVRPYEIMTDRPEVAEKMAKLGPDLAAAAKEAERDFHASLEKEARKHKGKTARTIDPLAWGVQIGGAALSNWKPQHAWEEAPIAIGQREFLARHNIEIKPGMTSGLANEIINRIMARHQMGLASPKTLQLLLQFGINETAAALMTQRQAGYLIGKKCNR